MTRSGGFLRWQQGVSVITAIFFLLLFAALAALMANMISTAHTTSAQDTLGARAYQSARAGVEWGLYQVLDPSNTTALSATAPLPGCFVPSPIQLSGMAATVNVWCTQFPPAGSVPDYYEEGTKRLRIYQITAKATLPGPGLQVERQVEVTAEKCRDTASTVAPFNC